MEDLVKNVTIRILIEMNKRAGIQVDRDVELSTEEQIKESIKDLVYKLLVNNGKPSGGE
ncbi:MAG: hypothetical protein ACTSVZ_13040 [Promethearchaeota archaeon]